MRQFILEKQKVNNGLIILEGKDFKYLRQVLRVKVGDMINVRLPDGNLQNSTVASIDEKSKKLILQICANSTKTITRGVQADEINTSMPAVEYWLFQFLPKPQKFEQIVRQATECGITNIVPIIGEYTEKSSVSALQGAKTERLERIIREARQQSGSPIDTKLSKPVTLDEAIQMWQNTNGIGFVLSERDDGNTLRETLEKSEKITTVAMAVGSEGGISPEEFEKLINKGLFHPVHFAVNILRCETAAIYGIAAVQSFVNELL